MGNNVRSFLIDTGAQYSALASPEPHQSTSSIVIQGATGSQHTSYLQGVQIELPDSTMDTIDFIHLPQAHTNLLGRDILCKTRALIDCHEDGMILVTFRSPTDFWRGTPPKASVCALANSSLSSVNPIVWATDQPGLMVTMEPVHILLKPGAQPICFM